MLKLPIVGIQQGYYTCVAEQTRLESKTIIEKTIENILSEILFINL